MGSAVRDEGATASTEPPVGHRQPLVSFRLAAFSLSLHFFLDFKIFMHMSILPTSVSVYCMYDWSPYKCVCALCVCLVPMQVCLSTTCVAEAHASVCALLGTLEVKRAHQILWN